MDNTNQPTKSLQESNETLKVSTSSDPHHLPKMLLIGLGTFLIIVIGIGIGYFMGLDNQPITNQAPTPTPYLNREKIAEEIQEQKCEFPEMIGNLTKGGINNTSAMVTRDTFGAVSSLAVSYSNLRSIDPNLLANDSPDVAITIATVDIVTFKTVSDAQVFYGMGSKKPEVSQFNSCTIKGMNGLCLFDSSIFTLPKGSSGGGAYVMIWLNGNTFKIVKIVTVKTERENIGDVDKRTKELVELFVSAFDDCRI